MSTRVKKIGNNADNRILISFNVDKLERIEKELNKRFRAQVGVLGAKASGRLKIEHENLGKLSRNKTVPVASDSSLSNADIGLIHEKGSPKRNIPRRSFLEVPLVTKMPGLMQRVGEELLKGLSIDNIETVYKKLAIIAESVVLRAFPTRGYGKWPSKRDGTPSRLIDTGQLRQSIASRVVSK